MDSLELEPLIERIPRRTLIELWSAVLSTVLDTKSECPTDPYSLRCPRADSLLWLESEFGELVFHFLEADGWRERLIKEFLCRHYPRVRRRYRLSLDGREGRLRRISSASG